MWLGWMEFHICLRSKVLCQGGCSLIKSVGFLILRWISCCWCLPHFYPLWWSFWFFFLLLVFVVGLLLFSSDSSPSVSGLKSSFGKVVFLVFSLFRITPLGGVGFWPKLFSLCGILVCGTKGVELFCFYLLFLIA